MQHIIDDFDWQYDQLKVKLPPCRFKEYVDRLISLTIPKLSIKKGDIVHNVTGIIKVEEIIFKCDRYNGRGERFDTIISFKVGNING